MIREAVAKDIMRIVELGSRSLVDGPYMGIIKDEPKKAAALALELISAAKGRVLLYADDETEAVHGLFAFIIYPQIFTGEPTATEVMWYVEPEHRKGGAGLRLLWEAEKMARNLGAKYMGVTSPTDEVSAVYTRFGYKRLEVSFMKSLNGGLPSHS